MFLLLMFVQLIFMPARAYSDARALLAWIRGVKRHDSVCVCPIHMQIVHIKSLLLHLNDNNVYNNNNIIRTHIIL